MKYILLILISFLSLFFLKENTFASVSIPFISIANTSTLSDDLDRWIPKYFQSRDIKNIRDIKKNYATLDDQKNAYVELRRVLLQRKNLLQSDGNAIIIQYYVFLINEIDNQISLIDEQKEVQRLNNSGLLQKLLDIF